jgi:hypothetical protein
MKVIAAVIGFLTIGPAMAASGADKQSSPAKGTKTCKISQYDSAYLNAHGNVTAFTLPRPYVSKDGSVQMGLAEDTYPGTKVYYLIGTHRYSGDAGYMVPIDKAGVEYLKKDPVIQFTYAHWPYRNEINGADVIEGFDAAYKDCLSFLRGDVAPKPRTVPLALSPKPGT